MHHMSALPQPSSAHSGPSPARSPGAAARREAVRQAFFDAARALFAEAGYAGVTLRRVGERCGYSAAAIYRHFEDKSALLFELCAQDWVRLAQALATAREGCQPGRTLPAVFQAYLDWALANRHGYHLMLMMGLPAEAERAIDQRWRQRFPQDPVGAVLEACVQDLQAAGGIATHHLPEDVADALWTAAHGLAALEITFEHLPREHWQPLAHRQHVLLDALLRGFAPSPPT
ncbi:hypothetical protein BKK79_11745 [Cupriavidus sp. USMAA2-4]|nr:hypothetical protein BKK79_11745 [Cupriavidus sp. USMAA2-4]